MRNSFPGYYRLNDRELGKLWKNCVFVVDANVLLNLYRYPKEAREDLLRVLRSISGRLWLPYQSALEYQRNRLRVIAEQLQRFDEVRKILNKARTQLQSELSQMQLKKRHSAIDPDGFMAKIDEVTKDFLGSLDKLEKEQPDVFSDDELRSRIDVIFDGKIGTPPKSQKDLDNIYQDGKSRYELQVPPGYDDLTKCDSGEKDSTCYMHNSLMYKKEYGDLILWHQILQEAKEKNWKHIIFITDDEKEDWWRVTESKGKKTIGPRPELIEELSNKAGVSFFHMYNSERFLAFANKYLKAKVEQESIDQVRETSYLSRIGLPPRMSVSEYARVESSVLDWLFKAFPDDEVIESVFGFPDFVRVDPEHGTRIGYDVKYARSGLPMQHFLRVKLRDVIYRGFYEMSKGNISSLKIVVIVDNEKNVIDEAKRILMNPTIEIPAGIGFILGTIDLQNESILKFIPLFES